MSAIERPARDPVAILIVAAAVVVTAVPFLIARFSTPDGMTFSGFLLFEMNMGQYFAWMEQARSGAFFLTDLFTTEETPPITINLYWYAAGTLARAAGVSVPAVYAVMRLASNIALAAAAVFVFRRLLANTPAARVGLAAAVFGTGLGWVYFLHPEWWATRVAFVAGAPIDVRLAEAFPFFTMLTYAHVAASSACILLGLYGQFTALVENRWKPSLFAGAVTLLVGFFHGFHIVTLAAVPVFFACVEIPSARTFSWSRMKFLIPAIAAAALAALWTHYEHARLPAFVSDAFRGQPSPLPSAYLLGLGPAAFLAAPSLVRTVRTWRKTTPAIRFLTVWLAAGTVFLYADPVIPFERRLVQGLIFPLAAHIGLSGVSLWRWTRELSAPAHTIIRTASVVCGALAIFPTTVALWMHILEPARTHAFPFYISDAERSACAAIRDHPEWGDGVLARHDTGVVVPWLTGGRRTYVGHSVLTPHFHTRKDQAAQFFAAPGGDAARVRFLTDNNIDLVYYGPRERNAGRWDPAIMENMALQFENNAVHIFRVIR